MGRKSKAVVRRQEILQTYYALMKTKGLEGISVANIAKKMEVNPSLLIHYFQTKEAIDIAFVHLMIEKFEEQIPRKCSEDVNPQSRLRKCLEWVTTPMEDSNILYGLFELSNRNEIVKPLLEKLYKSYEAYIRREIDFAVSHGLLDQGVREVAIWVLIATLQNVRNNYFVFGRTPSEDLIEKISNLLKEKKV